MNDFLPGSVEDELKELGEKLKKLDEKYPRLSTVMTLGEESQRTRTYVRIRGNWADKGGCLTGLGVTPRDHVVGFPW